MSSEVILAVDDTYENYFKNKPNTLKLVGEKIKLINIVNLQDKFVKEPNGIISLNEYDKPILLTPSLYKNVYYPTHSFDEFYRADLLAVMYDLACKMGAESYKIDFEIQVKKEENKSCLSKIKFKFFSPQAQGKGDVDIKFDIGKTINLSHKKNLIEEGKELVHYSVKKLQAYIDEQKIDIEALPSDFRAKVKQYLRGDPISSDVFQGNEKIDSVTQSIAEFNFKLKTNITNNVDSGFVDTFSDFKSIKEFKFISKISYEIKFAPKPKSEFLKFGD